MDVDTLNSKINEFNSTNKNTELIIYLAPIRISKTVDPQTGDIVTNKIHLLDDTELPEKVASVLLDYPGLIFKVDVRPMSIVADLDLSKMELMQTPFSVELAEITELPTTFATELEALNEDN